MICRVVASYARWKDGAQFIVGDVKGVAAAVIVGADAHVANGFGHLAVHIVVADFKFADGLQSVSIHQSARKPFVVTVHAGDIAIATIAVYAAPGNAAV